MRRSSRLRSLLCVLGVAVCVQSAGAQVLRFEELDAAAIGRLDRARTVVLIPGGILEEHGPHLPVNADGYRNERMARDIAAAIAARPGWSAVILPTVPLGSGGFNQMGGHPAFPGTVGIRSSTLQAVFSDLADALGGQGFRYVFVVHGHGDPDHNRALDLAGDYFRATYGGVMVHLLGRRGCQADGLGPPPLALLDSAARRADAGSPHAGAEETARTWFLRPDLVDSVALRRTPDITAPSPAEWAAAGRVAGWPGYVGAPRFATLQLGRWIYEREARMCTALALGLLDGTDEATVPRYADDMLSIPPVREAFRKAEEAQAARQAEWQNRSARRP